SKAYGGPLVTANLRISVSPITRTAQSRRSRKPDSTHTGTISITIRVRRASSNAMKPRIQCVLAQWNPGFRNHASLCAAAVDDENLVPHVGGGCGSGAGWGFVVVRRRRAGRKVDSGGGVPPVVTVRTWTVRGRVSD